MQSQFGTYLQLGYEHISDLNAYDHILFIIALCAIYRLAEWKKVLILVTAFTIGHSITLALTALRIIVVRTDIIEFLIPTTILITAFYNVLRPKDKSQKATFSKSLNINYLFALFFGLIHGMGFSSYFRSLLGSESELILPLFAFNIGIEVGQLIIVGIIMIAALIGLGLLRVSQNAWTLFISGACAGIALTMMMETKFW